MKRLLALVLVLCMVFALAGCSEKADTPATDKPEPSKSVNTEQPSEDVKTEAPENPQPGYKMAVMEYTDDRVDDKFVTIFIEFLEPGYFLSSSFIEVLEGSTGEVVYWNNNDDSIVAAPGWDPPMGTVATIHTVDHRMTFDNDYHPDGDCLLHAFTFTYPGDVDISKLQVHSSTSKYTNTSLNHKDVGTFLYTVNCEPSDLTANKESTDRNQFIRYNGDYFKFGLVYENTWDRDACYVDFEVDTTKLNGPSALDFFKSVESNLSVVWGVGHDVGDLNVWEKCFTPYEDVPIVSLKVIESEHKVFINNEVIHIRAQFNTPEDLDAFFAVRSDLALRVEYDGSVFYMN